MSPHHFESVFTVSTAEAPETLYVQQSTRSAAYVLEYTGS
jgi:hypothetical protein